MCEVEYAVCPDEVDCSGTSPVTGNIHLELPGIEHCTIHNWTNMDVRSLWWCGSLACVNFV